MPAQLILKLERSYADNRYVWRLAIRDGPVVYSQRTYKTEAGAKRAAVKWAGKLGLEITRLLCG